MNLRNFFAESKQPKVQQQGKTTAELKSRMEALTATVKEEAAQLQKVSARIEMSRPAPQVAENNQESCKLSEQQHLAN
jgi:hypothetical protein